MDDSVKDNILKLAAEKRLISSTDVFKIKMALKSGVGVTTMLRRQEVNEQNILGLIKAVGIEHAAGPAQSDVIQMRNQDLDSLRAVPIRMDSGTLVITSDDPTNKKIADAAEKLGTPWKITYATKEEVDRLLSANTPLPEIATKLIDAGLINEEQARDLAQRFPQDIAGAAAREYGATEEQVLRASVNSDDTENKVITNARPQANLIARAEAMRFDAVGAVDDQGPVILTFRPERLSELRAAFPNHRVAVTTSAHHAELFREAYPTPTLQIGTKRMRPLPEILVERQFLKPEEAALANAEQLAKERMSEDQWAQALHAATGRPVIEIESNPPDDAVRAMIPAQLIRTYLVYPHSVNESGGLMVLMADPRQRMTAKNIAQVTGSTVLPLIARESDIKRLISTKLDRDTHLEALNKEISAKTKTVEPRAQEEDSVAESGIKRIVEQIIREGIENEASDIHIEPSEEGVQVRYRIDGQLEKAIALPIQAASQVAARLKIMARLDVNERRLPQDGRIKFRSGSKSVEFRFSSLPVPLDIEDNNGDQLEAEKIVMRMLNKDAVPPLENLGLSSENMEMLKQLMSRPYGIILITGPTGSGKTTTGNSILSTLAKPNLNITTIEDPIEYRIKGVVQSQVNTKIDMTFERALRAFLRQDPDIIYVGEIRDRVTAKMAMEAAMTGHLVIATMHTNNAVGVVARLEEMGVERFNITASLVGVVAQRLVRRLCPTCRVEKVIDQSAAMELDQDPDVTVWSPSGRREDGSICPDCGGRGYRKRMGIHEVMVMTPPMEQAIGRGAPTDQLQVIAEEEGMINMRLDGLGKALVGETSIYEVISQTKGD